MATITPLLVTLALFVGQPYPDLSGTWMVDGDRSMTTNENGRTVHQRALGEMFVVKQVGDEMQLTLDNGKGLEWHHRLDGVETVKLVPGPKGHMVRTASRAVWEGSRLTITFRHPDNPAGSSTTQVLTLLSDGTLRVEVGPQGIPKLVSVYARIR